MKLPKLRTVLNSPLAGFAGLAIILVFATALRLYKIDTPLADWHSWRQADTASVTLEYLRYEALYGKATLVEQLLSPRFHDLSNIPSGLANLEGYRMVEFPIINFLVARLLLIAPGLSLVTTYRVFNLLLSVASIGLLYAIVVKLTKNQGIALLTALVMAIMPYSVFYSRTILPEVGLTFFNLSAVFFFILWAEHEKTNSKNLLIGLGWLSLTWLSLSLSFLLKPIAVFMAPVYLVIIVHHFGAFGWLKKWPLWLLATSILPLIAWRVHIQGYPAGIPANRWLLNGNGIRLRPAWWRWLFGDRLGRLILGHWGTGLALAGLASLNTFSKKRLTGFARLSVFDWFTLAFAAGWFSYLVVFATGNVQHDYYQISLIPVLSLLVARGLVWLAAAFSKTYPALLVGLALTGISGLALFLSWDQVRGYYQINNPAIVEAGAAAERLTDPEALIIAPYMGDTAFLFQTQRRGWPIGFEIDKKIEQGATHYLTTSYDDEARELETRFKTLEKTDTYLLLDLTTPLL